MPANLWELRADLRPLDTAAQAWRDVAEVMDRRGDEIVEAARRATDGWEAAAADSYEQHRRQVLAHLDLFTSLAAEMAASLQAIAAVLAAAQEELDRSWTRVAMVPHESVGESRHLVFHPAEEQHRGTVTRAQQEAEEIRGRLGAALEHEGGRLRAARAELDVVRSGLATLAGGRFPGGWAAGQDGAVGVVTTGTSSSTSVPGSAQAGVGALPPMSPVSSVAVDMPDIAGISAAGLAAGAAAALGRRAAAKPSAPTGPPPVGGMGAGAMGARAGSMSRGSAGGRAGARRMPAPVLEGAGGGRSGRTARGALEDGDAQEQERTQKQADKDAKRALLEDKRAQRAARRARRAAEGREDRDEPESADGAGEPAAAVAVVHHAPGEDPEAPRR